MSEKISVLLVDDHALVRRGFRRMLEDEEDITVKGEASDGEEAVRLARAATGRDKIVKFEGAYHGLHDAARGRLVEQGNRVTTQPECEHGGRAPRQHNGRSRHSQNGGAGGVCDSHRTREHPLTFV